MSCGCVDVAVIFRKICVCLDVKVQNQNSIDVNNELNGGLVVVVVGDEL